MEENQIKSAGGADNSPNQSGTVNEAYEWAESIVFALAVVVLIFTFIFRPVGVSGVSMENTLHNGDKVVISNINYVPKQGDIVVLSTKAIKEPIIKRVVAVGGQTVNIDYINNKVYVDGKVFSAPIKETMFKPESGGGLTKLPCKVPKGCVFVMGDNRNNSFDSRFSQIGIIEDKFILGHALFRILPFNAFGLLH